MFCPDFSVSEDGPWSFVTRYFMPKSEEAKDYFTMGYFPLHVEKNNYLLKMPLEFIIAPSSVFSAGNIDIHSFPIVSISKALTIYCHVYQYTQL